MLKANIHIVFITSSSKKVKILEKIFKTNTLVTFVGFEYREFIIIQKNWNKKRNKTENLTFKKK